MSNTSLHEEIRERGGAYGGGSSLGDGILNFYSYRDPNFLATFDAFKHASNNMAGGHFT